MSSSHNSSRRPPGSRLNSSGAHTPTVLTGEDLLMGDGPVTVDEAEYLHEFVHPHHHEAEETVVDDEDSVDEEQERRKSFPWWRRPSPWWYVWVHA